MRSGDDKTRAMLLMVFQTALLQFNHGNSEDDIDVNHNDDVKVTVRRDEEDLTERERRKGWFGDGRGGREGGRRPQATSGIWFWSLRKVRTIKKW